MKVQIIVDSGVAETDITVEGSVNTAGAKEALIVDAMLKLCEIDHSFQPRFIHQELGRAVGEAARYRR